MYKKQVCVCEENRRICVVLGGSRNGFGSGLTGLILPDPVYYSVYCGGILPVLLDNEEANKLAKAIINKKCIFIPYLGKNDHPANITDPVIVDLQKRDIDKETLDCLFPSGNFKKAEDVYVNFYKYQESLPIGLNEKTGLYEYMTFIHTNFYVDKGAVYSFNDKNIVFY